MNKWMSEWDKKKSTLAQTFVSHQKIEKETKSAHSQMSRAGGWQLRGL